MPISGAVTAHAVVHRHGRDGPPTPFVIAEVHTDAGPVIKSLVRGAGAGEVRIGARLEGVMDEDGFAFVPSGSLTPPPAAAHRDPPTDRRGSGSASRAGREA